VDDDDHLQAIRLRTAAGDGPLIRRQPAGGAAYQ
jgi:hypothetical protein